MPILLKSIAVIWATVLTAAPPADPAALEKRIGELRQKAEQQRNARNWEGVTGTLREMAALDPEHPKVYLQTVLLQERRGKLDEAAALMDGLGLPRGPGRTYGQGVSSFIQRHADEASRSFSSALKGYRSLGHIAGQAACHNGLGIIAKNASRVKEAIRQYSAARALLKKIQDERGMDDLLHETAGLEAGRGRYGPALARYRQSLALREKLGDRSAQAQSWNGIGTCLSAMGDREKALDAFNRALAIRRETQDWKGQISTLRELARLHDAPADLDKAMETLGRALEVADQVPDARSKAEVLQQQGEAFLAADLNREAVAPLDAASSLFKELKDARGEAVALGKLGLALNRLGEFRRSRGVLEAALEQARASKTPIAEAAALTDLGNALLAYGEPAQALIDQERALALSRSLKDRIAELSALNNLYASFFVMGLLDRSRTYLEQALRGFEALGDPRGVARSRSNLGVLLTEEHRPAEGLIQLRQAIRMRRASKDLRGTAISCAGAAEALLRLDRPREASPLLEEALDDARKSGDRTTEAQVLNVQGEAQLALGKPGAALESHRRALDIAAEAGLAKDRWRAHAGIADVLERQGKRNAAFQETLQAIDEIESVRGGLITGDLKMRFLARKIGLYESALARLIPTKAERADASVVAASFQLAERARARSLLDLLAESRSRLRAKLPLAVHDKEEGILEELSSASARLAGDGSPEEHAAARERIDAARVRLQELEIEIHRDAPRYGGLLYPRPATVEEVQSRILRGDEVLLEYFVGAQRTWLWTVDKQTATLRDLGSSDEIARLARAFLAKAATSSSDIAGTSRDAKAASARLSSVILPRGSLAPGAKVLVVADGPLLSVPFETLTVDGRFLVETHETVVVPSATVIGLLRSDPPHMADGGFLGVGAPVAGGRREPAASLPYARVELETAGRTFAEDERTLLIGPMATKSALKSLALEKFRYIHLATHGWIDADPRFSGLRLSPAAGGEDSVLSVDEIVSLRLASEVVVLSSCRSGTGERLAGEGTVGLARAFLYAGARSVLVSLWDVGDRSTAAFMSRFYAKLKNGESASQALRHAKLEFLMSDRPAWRQIHSWAPFVLVGDVGEGALGSNQAGAASTHQ